MRTVDYYLYSMQYLFKSYQIAVDNSYNHRCVVDATDDLIEFSIL